MYEIHMNIHKISIPIGYIHIIYIFKKHMHFNGHNDIHIETVDQTVHFMMPSESGYSV